MVELLNPTRTRVRKKTTKKKDIVETMMLVRRTKKEGENLV